jgi:two-component system chemotaxis response regulator CheB
VVPLHPEAKIRVLVVDDSAFMRKALTVMLESDPSIKVVGSARDGLEAIDKFQRLKPDLITLDIEMPRLDGLAALREIMAKSPVPVMMVSSATTTGAQATLDALELGAIDFISKDASRSGQDIMKIKDELLNKVKDIVSRKRASGTGLRSDTTEPGAPSGHLTVGRSLRKTQGNRDISIIAIGSSTGGPLALRTIVSRLPRNLPAGVVIAQHMPSMFTRSLAERLDSLSQMSVREAETGDRVEPGVVLIAPGGRHLTVRRSAGSPFVFVSDHPKDSPYRPSVDLLMSSVARTCGSAAMGVILTGMGSDGVEGLTEIKAEGGVVIAQNEQSCIIYGMPRAAIEADLADHIVSLDDIASEIVSYF